MDHAAAPDARPSSTHRFGEASRAAPA
jgi:hypothetical protein